MIDMNIKVVLKVFYYPILTSYNHIFCLYQVKAKFIFYYYIDTSVLLENIPLVNFIKTTSGTRVVYFP